MPKLVLASSSPYRRELLARLRLPFEVVSPEVDESPLAMEAPQDTALRLAQLKARAVAEQFPDALIIGSDQVALLGEQQVGKPHNFENAKKQLQAASERSMCSIPRCACSTAAAAICKHAWCRSPFNFAN